MTTPNQFAGILSGWQFVRNHSLSPTPITRHCVWVLTFYDAAAADVAWSANSTPKGFDETDILIPGRIELVIIIVIRIMMRGDSPYLCIDDEKVVEPEKVKGTARHETRPSMLLCQFERTKECGWWWDSEERIV